MGLKLKSAIISGFRGFNPEVKIDFNAPVVVLYGENATGKSSTLNAIEWCLFGSSEVVGEKNTGIRERIDWEIINRNAEKCYVEVELEKDGQVYNIRREKSNGRDNIYIRFSDGGKIEGKKAQEEINKLIGNFSFRDFMTCIYQHQEVIRYILTEEPRKRDEALDRLFGFSDYRNISEAIKKFSPKGDELEKKIDEIKSWINSRIDALNEIIKRRKEELSKKGLSRVDERERISIAKQIKKLIEDFCSEIGADLSEKFSKIDLEQKEFVDVAEEEIRRLRKLIPEERKLNELVRRKTKINHYIDEYDDLNKKRSEVKREIDKFVRENGDDKKIKEKVKQIEQTIEALEDQKEVMNLYALIIEKVMLYLESVEDKDICPVCGTRKKGLLIQLKKQWEKEHKEKFEKINKEIDSLKKELKDKERLLKDYERLIDDWKRADEGFRKYINKIRGDEKISEREDVRRKLEKILSELESEIERLKKSTSEKTARIEEIEEKIKLCKDIDEILKDIALREKIRDIVRTQEWKKLKELSDDFKKFVDDVERIRDAILRATKDGVDEIISNAGEKISEFFGEITSHPKIKKIKIKVEQNLRSGGNQYKFYDENDENLLPVLSQGNFNSLAISIFLAMSGMTGQKMPFDFIMLDDPSQSLGFQEKVGLIKILDIIAKEKDIIIATMDSELLDEIKKMSSEKKIYKFYKWTPEKGPEINEEIVS